MVLLRKIFPQKNYLNSAVYRGVMHEQEYRMRSLFLSVLLLFIAEHTLAEDFRCTDTHAIKSVVPKYPLNETPKPQTGYVVVSFKISNRGYVYSPEVKASHAEPSTEWAKLFEEEAIKAIMQFHFRYRERACTAEHKFEFKPK